MTMFVKRAAAMLLALVLFVVPLAGCSQKTSTAGKMHYDLAAEPVNLDPQSASDLASMTVINQIFEGLFILDQAGEPIPAAAESYTVSSNGLTYDILIQENLTWQDGSVLDAQDYAFGLQRVLLPDTQSPHASQFYGIKNAKKYHQRECDFSAVGIQADGLHLTITLEQPDEHFLNLLTLTATMPCDEKFFNKTKGKYGLEADVTLANGAFYLQTWSHNEYLKLTKNEKYRNADNTKISGVTMWTNNTENREQTFWQDRTQCCYVSGESYASHNTEKHTADPISNTIYGIVFNQNSAAMKNTYIRKAMAGLFDRSSYASDLPEYLTATNRVFASDCAVNSKPYFSMVTEDMKWQVSAKQAQAWYQKGLEQLGVNALTGLKLIVLEDESVPNGDYFLQLSQVYQKYLDLYIGIERLPKEKYDAAIKEGAYDLAILPIVSEDLSPISMLEDFLSGPYACGDAKFQKLYHQLQKTSTLDTITLLQQAERLLLEDGWFIPMYEASQYFVSGRDVAGVIYNPHTGLVSFRDAQYLVD